MQRSWVGFIFLLLASLACSVTSNKQEETPAATPTISLVNTTAPTAANFVRITSPVGEPATVNATSVTVSGEAGGIFENTIMVEARSANDQILDQEVVTFTTTEVGGSGTWQVTLQPNAAPDSQGIIYAYATSPRDGSVMAESRVQVTYTR